MKDRQITQKDIERWKSNSLKIAEKLGYDKNILERVRKKVKINLKTTKIPDNLWFGFANPLFNEVDIYSTNLFSKSDIEILSTLRNKNIPEKTINKIRILLKTVPGKILFEIFNQSGMDHELIGHCYNLKTGKDHSEKAAVNVQLEFAKERSGLIFHRIPWKIVSLLAPIILHYHKKDEF